MVSDIKVTNTMKEAEDVAITADINPNNLILHNMFLLSSDDDSVLVHISVEEVTNITSESISDCILFEQYWNNKLNVGAAPKNRCLL